MKFAIALLLTTLIAAGPAFADCFQLSRNGKEWAKTEEQLCVVGNDGGDFSITLQLLEVGKPRVLAQFTMDRLSAARCIDCNQDTYGVANPSNTLFNDLKIQFKGKRDSAMNETGRVTIGRNKFHYRIKRTAPANP